MDQLLRVYKCLCDETRLRILHLLGTSPLCVCHIQHILDISQVNASRHLGYLRKNGMVDTTRHQNWTIYALPAEPSPELDHNLACLQDLVAEHPVFQQDQARLEALLNSRDVRDVLKEGGCHIPNPVPHS
jgi:ArsR family transcriptional regulator